MAMQFSIKGLVLKVNETGADDKFLTVLTGEKGVISVFLRRRGKKQEKMGSIEVLCYSQFVLFETRDRYYVDSVEPVELFFPLRQDVERLAVAQYFCQLLQTLVPTGENGGDFLRLALNTLYFLGKQDRSVVQLKALFELRCLSLAGFMPDLVGCSQCGAYLSDEMFFSPSKGVLLCGACRQRQETYGFSPLPLGALAAMRHILYSDFQKLFSFTVSGDSLRRLATYAEQYVLCQTGRGYTALDFYKSLLSLQ